MSRYMGRDWESLLTIGIDEDGNPHSYCDGRIDEEWERIEVKYIWERERETSRRKKFT